MLGKVSQNAIVRYGRVRRGLVLQICPQFLSNGFQRQWVVALERDIARCLPRTPTVLVPHQKPRRVSVALGKNRLFVIHLISSHLTPWSPLFSVPSTAGRASSWALRDPRATCTSTPSGERPQRAVPPMMCCVFCVGSGVGSGFDIRTTAAFCFRGEGRGGEGRGLCVRRHQQCFCFPQALAPGGLLLAPQVRPNSFYFEVYRQLR